MALTGTISAPANDLTIGSWNDTNERISGTVNDVAVYRTALSAAHVAGACPGRWRVVAPPSALVSRPA